MESDHKDAILDALRELKFDENGSDPINLATSILEKFESRGEDVAMDEILEVVSEAFGESSMAEGMSKDELSNLKEKMAEAQDQMAEDLEDPEIVKQKIAEHTDQALNNPAVKRLAAQHGMSENQIRDMMGSSQFQSYLTQAASVMRVNPACQICGKKSKSSMSVEGVPLCSGKCRKKLLRSR